MTLQIDPLSPDEPLLVMRRTFDAPRELVWEALTEPRHVVRWYGGHGFENPVCEMDVRPGGRWHHVMRTPDGADHEIELVFVEVVPPEKLVWRSTGGAPGYHDNTMTVTLEAEGKRTRWTLVTRFRSIADRDLAARSGFTTVLGEGTDRVEQVLRTLPRSGAGAAR